MIEESDYKKEKKEFARGLCRKHLSYFVQRVFGELNPRTNYQHAKHIDLICAHLEATLTGELKRLIINLPPQMLKSTIVSVAFPAWAMGHDPARRFIGASYASALSQNLNQHTRTIVQSSWFQNIFPRCVLRKDLKTKKMFMTTDYGFRMSTSVGSAATGFGGNFLIMDDPHDPQQADSDIERPKAVEWFNNTFMSRLSDKTNGVAIIVMQRLHQLDVTGDQLAKDIGWHHLSLPSTAEKQEYVNFRGVEWKREPGDLLQPEFLTVEFLEKQKAQMGTLKFAGQYQQRPSPAGGGIFKKDWFRFYEQKPKEFLRVTISLDTANKDKELNDHSVATIWGETPTEHYLIYRWRERVQYPDLKRKVLFLANEFNPLTILIEDKASGTQLLQEFRRTTKLNLVGIKPQVSKTIRAASISPMVEAGKLWLPREQEWVDEYIDELITFPTAAFDDQVDSTSQYFIWTTQNPVVTSAKKYKPITAPNVSFQNT